MIRRAVVAAVALASLFLHAGCGDSTGPDAVLSPVEVEALLVGMFASGLVDLGDMQPGEWNEVASCPGGGEAVASGSFGDLTESNDTATQTWDVTFVHDDCSFTQEGTAFTLDGDPGIDYAGTLEIVGGFDEVNIDATLGGTVRWTTGDERSGSCALDVSLTFTGNFSSEEGSATGSACGTPVNMDIASFVS